MRKVNIVSMSPKNFQKEVQEPGVAGRELNYSLGFYRKKIHKFSKFP